MATNNGNGVESPSSRAAYSPTRGDAYTYRKGAGGRLILSQGYGVGIQQPLPKYLPRSPRSRDRVLYLTPRAESQWGSALGIAISKISSWAWSVESTSKAQRGRLQQLLLTADFGHPSGVWGWVPFTERLGRDFLCTNNGSFFNIARETTAYGSRIKGLHHLSSLRCRRTGDPDWPVLYIDRLGRETAFPWYSIVCMVDAPEPDDIGYGMGFCSAERAYDQIKKLAALEGYMYEKLTANSPTTLYLLNGITQEQLDDLLKDAEDQQAEEGMQQYMGAIIATMLKPDQTPAVASIPLAGLPDNASPEDERMRGDIIYANALGMDLNEIRPQGGQQLGAGASSQVLHEKQKGKGLISFQRQLHHVLNWEVFDPRSTFYFTGRDLTEEERRARIASAYSAAVERFIRNGTLSPRLGQEWLIEMELIPRRFADREIDDPTLSDIDKAALLAAEGRGTSGVPKPSREFAIPKGIASPVEPAQQTRSGQAPTQPRTAPAPKIVDRNSSSPVPPGLGVSKRP